MKIPIGDDGSYLEPDSGPRDSPFHRRIMQVAQLKNTRCGNRIVLDCGHQVLAFGDLGKSDGVLFCVQCRDAFHAQTRN